MNLYFQRLLQDFQEVYIISGPLWLAKEDSDSGKFYVQYQTIGDLNSGDHNIVSVPTHFYKVVLAEKDRGSTKFLSAFVIPNQSMDDKKDLQAFQVELKNVEIYTGLRFFPVLEGRVIPDLCASPTGCKLPDLMSLKN